MSGVAAIVAIAGTTVSIIGQQQEASARADATRRQSALSNLQADEVLRRADIEARALVEGGRKLIGRQTAAIARGGASIGGVSAIAVRLDTQRIIREEIRSLRQESQFKAQQLRSGADISVEFAASQRRAAILGSVATGLRGVGAFAGTGIFDKNDRETVSL